MNAQQKKVYVTQEDMSRLQGILDGHGTRRDDDALDALEALLARAEVVPPAAIPADVVTMSSRVVYEEEDTGRQREVTLVYPSEADPLRGRISVLAPVGSALLGLAAGQTREWELPGGRTRRFRILAVLHQPEAAAAAEAAPGPEGRPRAAGPRGAGRRGRAVVGGPPAGRLRPDGSRCGPGERTPFRERPE